MFTFELMEGGVISFPSCLTPPLVSYNGVPFLSSFFNFLLSSSRIDGCPSTTCSLVSSRAVACEEGNAIEQTDEVCFLYYLEPKEDPEVLKQLKGGWACCHRWEEAK